MSHKIVSLGRGEEHVMGINQPTLLKCWCLVITNLCTKLDVLGEDCRQIIAMERMDKTRQGRAGQGRAGGNAQFCIRMQASYIT